MKHLLAILCVGFVVASCASSGNTDRASKPTTPISPTPDVTAPVTPSPSIAPVDPVVARVDGRTITQKELEAPLIDAYGLNVLMNLVQLELAQDLAEKQGMTVTQADIDTERKNTIAKLDLAAEQTDHEQLLQQLLEKERISLAEFEIVVKTNAHLRKVMIPQLESRLSEEALQEAFRQLYGESVKARHIQCQNLQEISEAQRRLAAGESFEKVATALSRNPETAPLGGELPVFSRAMAYPQAFKDTAFSLQEGEISDPVQADGAYHLIRVDKKIAPIAVKYEEHRDAVRKEVLDRLSQQGIRELRQQMAQQAIQKIQIENPVLKAQFEQKLKASQTEITDRDAIRREIERQRTTTTQPATLPVPTPAAELERPPATSGN